MTKHNRGIRLDVECELYDYGPQCRGADYYLVMDGETIDSSHGDKSRIMLEYAELKGKLKLAGAVVSGDTNVFRKANP